MKKEILIFGSLFFLFLIYLFFFGSYNIILEPSNENNNLQKVIINSGGSTSMSKLLNVLSEEFTNENPGYFLQKSETGSGAAINEVLSGNYDLGDISRSLKEDESPERFNQVVIALDGIVVIVNKKNPIKNLNYNKIKDIFHNKIKNWSEIIDFDAPITTIGREESSGTREGFENILNIGVDVNHLEYSVELSESGDIISRVASEEGAIGYVSFASISGNVKSISIDNIECTIENIKNKSYRIIRPFLQISLKNKNDNLIKKWFEFIFSPKGKKIIENEKFISIF